MHPPESSPLQPHRGSAPRHALSDLAPRTRRGCCQVEMPPPAPPQGCPWAGVQRRQNHSSVQTRIPPPTGGAGRARGRRGWWWSGGVPSSVAGHRGGLPQRRRGRMWGPSVAQCCPSLPPTRRGAPPGAREARAGAASRQLPNFLWRYPPPATPPRRHSQSPGMWTSPFGGTTRMMWGAVPPVAGTTLSSSSRGGAPTVAASSGWEIPRPQRAPLGQWLDGAPCRWPLAAPVDVRDGPAPRPAR